MYGFISNVHPSRRNLVTYLAIFYVFLTYTHLRDFAKCMALSVTYIRQGGILLLSHFLCFLLERWLDLLARRHWLNSSFIDFESRYIHLVRLLVVILQVFNIPWPRESLSVHGFQVVAALSRVVDDSIWSFPCGAKISLGRISGCKGNLAQDEITYVKSFELYPFIVVVGHLLLILRHSDGSFFSYFVQEIQV